MLNGRVKTGCEDVKNVHFVLGTLKCTIQPYYPPFSPLSFKDEIPRVCVDGRKEGPTVLGKVGPHRIDSPLIFRMCPVDLFNVHKREMESGNVYGEGGRV